MGLNFQDKYKQERRGRVVYAGGDDFLGVMYSDQKGVKLKGSKAVDWLIGLREDWRGENKDSNNWELSLVWVLCGQGIVCRSVMCCSIAVRLRSWLRIWGAIA